MEMEDDVAYKGDAEVSEIGLLEIEVLEIDALENEAFATGVLAGAPGPLITRLSELRRCSARLKQARAFTARRTSSLLARLWPK